MSLSAPASVEGSYSVISVLLINLLELGPSGAWKSSLRAYRGTPLTLSCLCSAIPVFLPSPLSSQDHWDLCSEVSCVCCMTSARFYRVTACFSFSSRCTYAVGNHDFIEAYKCQTVIVQYPLSLMAAVRRRTHAVGYLGLETRKHRASRSFLQLERNDSVLEEKLFSTLSLGYLNLAWIWRLMQSVSKEEPWWKRRILPCWEEEGLGSKYSYRDWLSPVVKYQKSRIQAEMDKSGVRYTSALNCGGWRPETRPIPTSVM